MTRQKMLRPAPDYPAELLTEDGELGMLAMLLTDNRRVDQVADILRAEDFSVPYLGRIYGRVCELVTAGQQANPITLKPLLEQDVAWESSGGTAMLAQLTGGSAAAFMLVKAKDQAAVITERAARRRLVATAREIIGTASDPDRSVSQLVDDVDAALVASIEKREASTDDTLYTSIGRALDRIEQIKANDGRIGATSGIADLDDLLGGVEPGQLIIVGARPGMGKTALACSLATGYGSRGHGVQFFSLEMRSEELGMRMVSDLCCRGVGQWIPFKSIVNGDVTGEQFRQLRAARDEFRALPVRIRDFSAATLARLSLSVRRAKRQMAAKGGKLEVVIVDYLQLLHADNPGASAYEAVSQISRGLKALAKELEVAVIALAQLSRAVEQREDKRPQLSDLRDSGQIEQDADAVLFLYREEYYLERAKPKAGNEDLHERAKSDAAGLMTLILAKRRNGRVGNATCQYLAAYQAVRSFDWGR
ncbi:replicative DNA helicase [Sphingomonas sp. OTU376]|uniref:replicative DNA helicase n=1 Tax=Sphingomonas sp. OTU376 TaxID=3043863 RepID=UPI00313C1078